MNYDAFLQAKAVTDLPSGFEPAAVNAALFDFQADVTRWALRRGRAAIFGDCGLGKTPMQLAWSDAVRQHAGPVLIAAPLAVAAQTVAEGQKFGVELAYSRDGTPSRCGITITNYEMLSHFDPADYAAVVLDESSILKSFTGKTRTLILDMFQTTPYRLACTATPAPNDLMELGNHAEFVGAMSRTEMLAMFFVHDGGDTQQWRIKGHAKADFWRWVCSWAVMIRKPSDLGYDDGRFCLPPLRIHNDVVAADQNKATETLFVMEAGTLQERQQARRDSVEARCRCAAARVNASEEPWLIWCDRNDESRLLRQMIDGAVEITGSDPIEVKEERMMAFSRGEIRRLVTKPSIAGFGMNWQHCCRTTFVGLSDSYEQFYQAVRRTWRFGQEKPVDCYIVTSETEGAVVANIKRKEAQAVAMAQGMVQNMHGYNEANIKGLRRDVADYRPVQPMAIPAWLGGAA